jgi:hypothetical protein
MLCVVLRGCHMRHILCSVFLNQCKLFPNNTFYGFLSPGCCFSKHARSFFFSIEIRVFESCRCMLMLTLLSYLSISAKCVNLEHSYTAVSLVHVRLLVPVSCMHSNHCWELFRTKQFIESEEEGCLNVFHPTEILNLTGDAPVSCSGPVL